MEKSKKKKGLSRLFEIAGQRKGLLILAGLLSAGSAVCMLVPYWAVYEILKELLSNGSNLSALDGTDMMRWGWIAFGGLVGGLILLYAALMSSHVAAFRILYGLRVRLSEHIGKLPLGYLNNTSTGAIKKTMDQNIEKIEGFIAHTIPDLVNVVATVAVMLVIFFSLDVWLTVVCLAVVVLSLFLQFSNFMGKRAREFMGIYYDAQEKMSASAVQYVRGMPVVKIFGQSVRSFRQFNAEIQAYKTFALKCCDTYQNGMIAFTVLLNSMVTFILPVGILLMQASPQSLSLAVVWLFFIIMGPGMASPVYKLTFLGGNTRDIDEGVNRIDRILEKKPVPEPVHPQVPAAYDVEFRHVSFSYENTEQGTRTEALRDVSFIAPQGKITALVGPSGSGKSTVANLIPRFWDVEQGEICIGGIDIRQIDTAKLMDMVSFVFQDTFLFYDTLYENIAVGSPDATEETVIAAAKAAQCHDFIERLPQGYETRIGDKGVFLSGGEAQRICVARAILKNAPILVLDEATAFADPENEHKMQMALQSLIKDKTVIVIAHRLSSIISAHQIVVMKEGRIVQCGKHEQLSVTEGVYKNMWDAYTSAYHWTLNKTKSNMRKKNFLNKVLQNTSCPQGFWGRMILRGMNCFHASLANRGMKQVEWQPNWNVLDIGCGGGANLKRLLNLCPKGNIYGIDLSEESVSFAQKYNEKDLNKRCFIQQGNVCSLPYEDGFFNAITAFETVYFWSPVNIALSEVARVLQKGGCFLVCLEASDPELGKMWTERIDGMVVYTPTELEERLHEAGFSSIRTIRKKEEIHIIAHK